MTVIALAVIAVTALGIHDDLSNQEQLYHWAGEGLRLGARSRDGGRQLVVLPARSTANGYMSAVATYTLLGVVAARYFRLGQRFLSAATCVTVWGISQISGQD